MNMNQVINPVALEVAKPSADEPQPPGIPCPPDVSPRVHELMQRIDRLPAGVYELVLVKPDLRAMNWNGKIIDKERDIIIDTFSLPKRDRNYQPE